MDDAPRRTRIAGGVRHQDQPLDLGKLTPAERRVFDVAIRGAPVKEIAAELVVTEATVASHLSRIYAKLGVRSRAELIARASLAAAEAQTQSMPLSAVHRPRMRSWAGTVVAAFALLAGILMPIPGVLLGPPLLIVAASRRARSLDWARWVVLAVGAVLVAEGLLLLVVYRTA